MRRLVRLTAGGVLALVALNGCAGMSRPACMATAALAGAIPGGVGGGPGSRPCGIGQNVEHEEPCAVEIARTMLVVNGEGFTRFTFSLPVEPPEE